ncbi:hypothetical protein M3A85_10820 [Dermabacter hominis]|nr:hypothetical protein [Dermabacter hominis]
MDNFGGYVEGFSERPDVWSVEEFSGPVLGFGYEEAGGGAPRAGFNMWGLWAVVAVYGVGDFVGEEAAGLRVGEVAGEPYGLVSVGVGGVWLVGPPDAEA